MKSITRSHEETTAVIDIDCPWCTAEATIETGATGAGVATFVCRACSIGVELAPDPVTIAVALAA